MILIQLARQDGLLQIAARHQAYSHTAAVTAYVELLDQLVHGLFDLGVGQHASARVGRPVVTLEHDVVFEWKPGGEPNPQSVLGHIGQPGLGRLLWARRGAVGAGDLDGAVHRGSESSDHLLQLSLTVSGNARDPHDLTSAHCKAGIVDRHQAVVALHTHA